ncbi:hypothetical protein [Halobellus rufus]|uniref:hypothetical protein n=1 Tax=Halobellus rufus TaxID=1448860 RepID=UPI000678FEB1|nr:hypothetical protein [Halobellus rufus]
MDLPRPLDAIRSGLSRPLDALRSTDAVRIERLFWAGVFAALVAVFAALVLAPDPTGAVSIAVALAAFAVVAPIAARLSAGSVSPNAQPGDQTVRYVVFFAVATVGRVGFGALGYDGLGASIVTFGAAWVLATRAEWLNPRRWSGGTTP